VQSTAALQGRECFIQGLQQKGSVIRLTVSMRGGAGPLYTRALENVQTRALDQVLHIASDFRVEWIVTIP
jgi:hypothetical protein